MSGVLSSREPLVAELDAYIDANQAQLIGLVQSLVRLDTTSVDLSPGSEHTSNAEGELQSLVAEELVKAGCEVDQWEPDPRELARHPMMPSWHHWRGRPLTVGILRSSGHGRSLIVNGHVDVVSAGDPARWSADPFAGEVREGRVIGRGACDMKGGIGAALFALQALRACDARLEGEVIFEAVTDEETYGIGTIAAIERGYKADAGFVPEPTNLDLWIATRGILHASCTFTGRSAHAEVNQPGWHEGGGVNAIVQAAHAIDALDELSGVWAARADKRHALLGAPQIHPTLIRGGAFISNVPEHCELSINSTYLPGDADEAGYGSVPKREIEQAVARLADVDDWLSKHPPAWRWLTDYPPTEIAPDAEVVTTISRVCAELGREPALRGIDSAYDGALLTRFAGTPSPAWGPGDLGMAHAVDESIGIDELALAARLYVRMFLAWCR